MREARLRAGLTLRQLGEKSGVQYGTIWRIEQDRNHGTIQIVELLADALGLSIDAYTGHEVKGEEDDHIGTDCG